MSSEANNPNLFQEGMIFLKKGKKLILKKKWEVARENLHKAKDKFIQTNSSLTEAEALWDIGLSYEYEQNLHEALIYYNKSLERRQIAGTSIIKSDSYRKIAELYLFFNNYDEAHQNSQKAVDLLEHENQPIKTAEIHYLQGTIYLQELDYSSALFYYNMVLEYVNYNFSNEFQRKLFENLAKTYQNLGKFPQSNKYFLKSLEIEQRNKNFIIISEILQNIAINFKNLEIQEKSIYYMLDALEFKKKFANNQEDAELGYSYLLYAEILFHFNQIIDAEKACEKSIEIAELSNTQNSKNILVDSLLLMAKIIESNKTKDPNKNAIIEQYLDEAFEIAEKVEYWSGIVKNYIVKSQNKKKRNDIDSVPKLLEVATNFAQKSDKSKDYGDIFEEYGLFYYSQKEYEQAVQYFKQANEKYTLSNSVLDVAETYYNIACTSSLMHLPEETIENLKKAIEIKPYYKTIAKNDKDFAGINKEAVFLDIIK